MSATCKQCQQEYYGPSVPSIIYSQYCQICKQCSKCHKQIEPESLEFNLKYSVEWPWLCENCQGENYRESIEMRRIPITAKELDWLNRARLMIHVNLDCSIDTNMRTAELASESWISEMSQEEAYLFLKRMESIVACVSVALKKSSKEIKLSLEAKERVKYQAARTTSARTTLEQCPHCKKRFPGNVIASHTAKCLSDLTPQQKAYFKAREKAKNALMSIGMTEEQADEQMKETFDKMRTKP